MFFSMALILLGQAPGSSAVRGSAPQLDAVGQQLSFGNDVTGLPPQAASLPASHTASPVNLPQDFHSQPASPAHRPQVNIGAVVLNVYNIQLLLN